MFRKTIPLLWLMLLLLPQLSSAEDSVSEKQSPEFSQGQIEIEGDSLETLLDRKMKARGNAFIKKGDKTISSELIEYDEISGKISTLSNTKIDTPQSKITGSKLNLKLDNETGQINDATFEFKDKSGKTERTVMQFGHPVTQRLYTYRGEAKTIFFEGENRKKLETTKITTCEVGNNDWYINASTLNIEQNINKAEGKNAVVEFKNVPIFYSPYFSMPLDSALRKSGFLSPNFGSTSTSGFMGSIPYYFNISPNQDATLTSNYSAKRGAQFEGEYRYLSSNFSGKDYVEIAPHDNANGKDNRFYIDLEHQQNFGNGLSASYNIQRVGDKQYMSDYASLVQITNPVNLPQRVNVNYISPQMSLLDNSSKFTWNVSALAEKYQTLSTVYSDSPYQRLPQVNLSAKLENDLYLIDLKSQYTYFSRDESFKNYLDANNQSHLYAEGGRSILAPSISIPLQETYGFIKPKFSMNIRDYQLDNASVSSKQIITPIFSLDSGVYFDRPLNLFNNSYTNTLEPRLYYVYIPYRDQSMLPLFDTGLTDLNMNTVFSENQFNGYDRVNDANQISAGLTSKLLSNNGKELIKATIAERFYLTQSKVNQSNQLSPLGSPYLQASNLSQKSSDIFLGLTSRLNNNWNVDAMWDYAPSTNKLLRDTISSRYNPEPNKIFNISYRYINNTLDTTQSIKDFGVAGQWPLGHRYSAVGRIDYDLLNSRTAELLAGVEYNGGCWVARTIVDRLATINATAPVSSIMFQLELNGLGAVGSDPNKLGVILNRNIPGVRTVNQIPDQYRQSNMD